MTTTESMANPLRPTGISVIGDVRWGTHFCYFYETKQDLLDALVPYFKAGLENNEFCLWVVSQPVTVEEAIHALEQAVPDFNRHLAERNVEIHDHDEWYLHNGRCDPKRVLQGWREKLNLARSEEHTSELQSHSDLVCRLLLEIKKQYINCDRRDQRARRYIRCSVL